MTARQADLIGCRRCARVWPPGRGACGLCGAALASRRPQALQWVWAWWLAGLIAFIPANLYPMLVTTFLGERQSSTIVGGVVELVEADAAGIALIVFAASVVIPVAKFIAIAVLALAVDGRLRVETHRLHWMHEAVEFIGRWSMIDVFVVAILAALVNFGRAAEVHPGFAAICFAATVISTMISAQCLDSRLIWDRARQEAP